MGMINFIVGCLAFVILVWDGFDNDSDRWVVMGVACVVLRVVLGVIWYRWDPDAEQQDRFARAVCGALTGVMLAFAASGVERGIPGDGADRFLLGLMLGAFSFWIAIKDPE